jgi:hypothetical protein
MNLLSPCSCAAMSDSTSRRSDGSGQAYLNRNFRFQLYLLAKPYIRRPLASTSNRPGRGWVASAAPLAVPLAALACFSLPTRLAAGTSPHRMIPQHASIGEVGPITHFSGKATYQASGITSEQGTASCAARHPAEPVGVRVKDLEEAIQHLRKGTTRRVGCRRSFRRHFLHCRVERESISNGQIRTSCELSCVSSAAGFCPVARRIIHLDSDYKEIIRIGLTVYDAGMRVEIATD